MSFGSFFATAIATFYLETINVSFMFNLSQVVLVLGHSLSACLAIVSSIASISFLGGLGL